MILSYLIIIKSMEIDWQVTGLRRGIIDKKVTKNVLQKCHFEYGKWIIQTNTSEMNFWLTKYLQQNMNQKIDFTNAVLNTLGIVLRLKFILTRKFNRSSMLIFLFRK